MRRRRKANKARSREMKSKQPVEESSIVEEPQPVKSEEDTSDVKLSSSVTLPGETDTGIRPDVNITPVSCDCDSEGSEIRPVVVTKNVAATPDAEDDDEIRPVVVNKAAPAAAAAAAAPEAPAEKKERKASGVSCVGGWFSSEGVRGAQEDRFKVDDSCAFYAVYDGHGGDKASKYCEKHMKDYVMEKIDELEEGASDEDYEEAFKDAFVELDEKFLEKRVDDGSTACVAHVSSNGKLYVANVGDSRAIVVCDDGSVVEMSQDHKPDLPQEKKRIEAAYHDVEIITDIFEGKRIKIARVDGMLAVSRAIGDGSLKDMMEPEKCAVTCVPEVRSLVLDPAKHRFLVIACDGIWDMYSNKDVATIVSGELGGKKQVTADELTRVSELVVKGSIDKGSGDNCTVVLVAL